MLPWVVIVLEIRKTCISTMIADDSKGRSLRFDHQADFDV
jgi:hypothetical protein